MKLNGCWQVKEKGKAQMNSFIEQRLNTNTVSFWDSIPNQKINTFASMTKKTRIKSTNEKLVTLTENRDLFGRLLIVANARQVNVREILCYELSTVPYVLADTDGTQSQEDHQKLSTPDSGKLCDCKTSGLPYRHVNS